MNKQLCKKLERKYNVKIIQVVKGDEYWEVNGGNYINRSYIIGREIILGIYTDREYKIASLFHEIGHTLVFSECARGQIAEETSAWLIGCKIAKKYGYAFSAKTYSWIREQINSYRH